MLAPSMLRGRRFTPQHDLSCQEALRVKDFRKGIDGQRKTAETDGQTYKLVSFGTAKIISCKMTVLAYCYFEKASVALPGDRSRSAA